MFCVLLRLLLTLVWRIAPVKPSLTFTKFSVKTRNIIKSSKTFLLRKSMFIWLAFLSMNVFSLFLTEDRLVNLKLPWNKLVQDLYFHDYCPSFLDMMAALQYMFFFDYISYVLGNSSQVVFQQIAVISRLFHIKLAGM